MRYLWEVLNYSSVEMFIFKGDKHKSEVLELGFKNRWMVRLNETLFLPSLSLKLHAQNDRFLGSSKH